MLGKSSLAAGLAVVLFSGISFGLGSGWIRIGPNASPDARPSPRHEMEAPPSLPATLPSEGSREARAPLDPGLMQAANTLPLAIASAAIGQAPATIFEQDVVKKQIKTTVEAATARVVTSVLADSDVTQAITKKVNLAEVVATARTAIELAVKNDATAAAITVILKAVNDAAHEAANALSGTPTLEQQTTAATAGAANAVVQTVIDLATKTAETAALAAVEVAAKPFVKLRDAFADTDLIITIKDDPAAAEPLSKTTPPKNPIKTTGPSVTITTAVKLLLTSDRDGRKFDDTGSQITLELLPASSSLRLYFPIAPDNKAVVADNTATTRS